MSRPIRRVRVPTSRHWIVNQVLASFEFLHYVDTGDCLYLQDAERRMEVRFENRYDETGDVAPDVSHLQFNFFGYANDDPDALLKQYLRRFII